MMYGLLECDYFKVKPMIKRKKAAEAALKFTDLIKIYTQQLN